MQHIIWHRTKFFLTFTFTILKCRNKGRSVKHFTCKEAKHISAMLQDCCSKNNENCTEPITLLQTTKVLCYKCLMLSVLIYAYYKHKINTLIIFTAELRYFCVWIHEVYYIQKFFENPVLAIVPHAALCQICSLTTASCVIFSKSAVQEVLLFLFATYKSTCGHMSSTGL